MRKIFEGNLLKMQTENTKPISYYLYSDEDRILMNSLIDKRLRITYSGRINCVSCDSLTKTSFHNGYCYSCFTSLPQTDKGVLHPELDLSHEGISRDMEWAKKHSLVDHFVYLSVTGNLKVGVTRYSQIPTRWIDQGAISAIKLARTPYRQLAGLIEVELKKYVSDKTNARAMIQAKTHEIDLLKQKKELANLLPLDLQEYVTVDNSITELSYPAEGEISYKTNLRLDKLDEIYAKLVGIKGQYLIFEDGLVFNVRNHQGYYVKIEQE
ncbi:MAG: DUF2797 domain-containing protein [Bacteroidales bacterium]|nr:DUF2797 domain-containing protein [Bacteroidales bacterium]